MRNNKAENICGFIGLTSLALWISVLIFGNYLIPTFYPSVVRAITFSIFAIFAGYCAIADDYGNASLYFFWTIAWIAFVMAVWRYGDIYNHFVAFMFWGFLMIVSLIIYIIIWLATKVERATRAARKKIKKAAKEIENAVIELFEEIINGIIDVFSIRESVNMKCPQALKVQILEKKKHAVNVGIFGNNNVMIAKEEIVSSEGVAEELYKGQIIYC